MRSVSDSAWPSSRGAEGHDVAARARYWKGSWWIFVNHDKRRKAYRLGACDKKTATDAAKAITAKLALGDTTMLDTAPAPSVPTFADVARDWLEKYPALHAIRPGTLENYESFYRAHLLPYFGDRLITEITARGIEDFIADKRGPGGSVRVEGKALSDSTLHLGLMTLRLILQRAVRLKLLAANPMLDVEWRAAPRIEHVDPFTPAELRAILRVSRDVDPDFATLVEAWARTGMRAGEVCGLQGHDVHLELGTVLVRRTWSRGRLGPTKTGRERTVSVLHPIAEDTGEWRPNVDAARSVLTGLRGRRVQSLDPEAPLFTHRGGPWVLKTLHRQWRRVLAIAHVRYRVPEQLRHTFASTMLSRNAPLLYVQRCGGWRSAAVLLRVYARWMPQEGDGVQERAAIVHQSAPDAGKAR